MDSRLITRLSALGAFAGLGLGVLDATHTLVGGYCSLRDAGAYARFTLWTIAIVSVFGAIIGWGMGAVVESWRSLTPRVPSRWRSSIDLVTAPRVQLAALSAAIALLVFLYTYRLPPELGLVAAGRHGFGKPVTIGLVVLLSAPLVCAACAYVVLSRLRRAAVWVVWTTTLLLLYVQLSWLLYADSRTFPVDYVHLGTLLASLVLLTGGLHARMQPYLLGWPKTKSAWKSLCAVGVATVVLALGVAQESNDVRLALSDRTALAASLVRRSISAMALGKPAEAPSRSSCRKPRTRGKRSATKASTPTENTVRGVVLIVIDTLRADRVGATRDGHALMPNFSALARDGRTFTRAYATHPFTPGAVGSLLSSRYLPPPAPTRGKDDSAWLSSWLRRGGIRTLAIPVHETVRALVSTFDIVDHTICDTIDHRFAVTSESVFARVSANLEILAAAERFFALVHLYDPHGYYMPNAQFNFGARAEPRYDAEVAYTDYWLGRIVSAIRQRFARDEVAFIVTADHGEEFFDHRYTHHGHKLYDESTRVPLVFVVDRWPAERLTMPVSGVDIAPTVLDLFGLPAPGGLDGVSLSPSAPVPRNRPIFLRVAHLRGVVLGAYKAIIDTRTGTRELYALDVDPLELRNLSDAWPQLTTDLLCEVRGTLR